jgi:hypothetical protein
VEGRRNSSPCYLVLRTYPAGAPPIDTFFNIGGTTHMKRSTVALMKALKLKPPFDKPGRAIYFLSRAKLPPMTKLIGIAYPMHLSRTRADFCVWPSIQTVHRETEAAPSTVVAHRGAEAT